MKWQKTSLQHKGGVSSYSVVLSPWQLYLHVKWDVSNHSNQKFWVDSFQIHVLKCCDCSWWISEKTSDVQNLWAKWLLSRIPLCILKSVPGVSLDGTLCCVFGIRLACSRLSAVSVAIKKAGRRWMGSGWEKERLGPNLSFSHLDHNHCWPCYSLIPLSWY